MIDEESLGKKRRGSAAWVWVRRNLPMWARRHISLWLIMAASLNSGLITLTTMLMQLPGQRHRMITLGIIVVSICLIFSIVLPVFGHKIEQGAHGANSPETDNLKRKASPALPEGVAEESDLPKQSVVDFALLLRACVEQVKRASDVFETFGVRERSLDLAQRHLGRLDQLALRAQSDLASMTTRDGVESVKDYIKNILPHYIEVLYESIRRSRSNCDDDETFRRERKLASFKFNLGWHSLEGEFKQDRLLGWALSDPKRHSEQWRLLGFGSGQDMREYLWPSMASLPNPPSEYEQALLKRLLNGPVDVEGKGDDSDVAVELYNRLLIDKWVSPMVGTRKIQLTDLGRQLLEERMSRWKQ